MKKRSWNRIFLELLSDRPISFIPTLAKVSGSANAGLFMSQLLYWWKKGRDSNWIYKTIEEIRDETYLSRREQDTAIAIWIRLGVLSKKRVGIPPKRHFRIDTERLTKLVVSAKQIDETHKSKCGERQNTTENTPESTTENFRIYNTGAQSARRDKISRN